MQLILGTASTCDRWLLLHANEPTAVLQEKISVVTDVYQRLLVPHEE